MLSAAIRQVHTTGIATLSSSAYQPPVDDQESGAVHEAAGDTGRKLLPFAQLGLRLLGVLLLVDGTASLAGGAIQSLFQARAYQASGYAYTLDPHSAGWMASGVPAFLSGLYLAFDGRWVLANIFTLVGRGAAGDAADTELSE